MVLDVKICGLKSEAALETALRRGATHAGFIFFEKSPRNIAPGEAAHLRSLALGRAQTVAVTVDAGDGMLAGIVETMAPDLLQLHGAETPERVAEVKRRFGVPVIKAFAIRDLADLDRIAPYRGVADRLLFDAKPPQGSKLPGGNGVAFDWTVLHALDGGVDYMLSGGLDAANIRAALRAVSPRGIDISSGLETAPGVKDVALIERFFDALDEARTHLAA